MSSCLHASPLLENGNDPWRDPTHFQERHLAAAASVLALKKEMSQKKMGFGYAGGLPGRSPDKASLARGACVARGEDLGAVSLSRPQRVGVSRRTYEWSHSVHTRVSYILYTHTHTQG